MAFSYNYYQHYLNDLCRCAVTDCVSFHCWDCCCCCWRCCTSKQIILCKTLSGTLVLTITHKYNWKMCTRTKHREHEINKEAQTSHTNTHLHLCVCEWTPTVKLASITCNALRWWVRAVHRKQEQDLAQGGAGAKHTQAHTERERANWRKEQQPQQQRNNSANRN